MLVGIRPIQTSCGSQAVSPVTTTIAPLLLVGSINVGAEPLAALRRQSKRSFLTFSY